MSKILFLLNLLVFFNCFPNENRGKAFPFETIDKNSQNKKKSVLSSVETIISDEIFDISKLKNKKKEDANLLSKPERKDQILIDELQAIVLIGSVDHLIKDTKNIKGILIERLKIPGNINELTRRLRYNFLNKPLTKDLILGIKQQIISFYKHNDHPVVSVLIPKQNISDNILQVIILESKLDKIYVKNNKYLSSRKITNAIRLQPNDTINSDTLLTDIHLLNKNPFVNANAILKASDKIHRTDIEIFINDIKPFRAYIGGDNSGTEFTDRNRWFIGFNAGKIFNYNNLLSFQFTASDDFKKFIAYTGSYVMNYPSFTLNVFGGYSKVKPNLVGLRSKGKSTQLSVRVEKPIGKVYLPLQQMFIIGGDYKTSNNNITTVQEIAKIKITNAADLTQFVLGYKVTLNSFAHNLYVLNELNISPAKLLTHQTDTRYNALHPDAKVKYIYISMLFDYVYTFYKKWKIHSILRAQASTANLLPSEQFDLGGQDTIRGYDNRLVTRDNAILVTAELRAHPISILKYSSKKRKDELILLGFVDFGYGADHKRINNENHSLLSTGAGLRYTLNNNILVRFDWGYPIFKVLKNKRSQVYLTATLSY